MKNIIKELVIGALESSIKRIESDTCEMTEEQALEILDLIAEQPMSKDQSYNYLRISRATFDGYVRQGLIPPGKKRKGFKELVWYKSDLDLFSNKFNS